jgi:energy-coupling factor transporter ATP-binding protein EcfA2
VTVVLITHDMQIARNCSRILMLLDGRIVHDGAEVPKGEEVVAMAPSPVAVS